MMLKKFRNKYQQLKFNVDELSQWQWPSNQNDFMFKQAQKIVDWGAQHLQNITFQGDYNELLELVVYYLGGRARNIIKSKAKNRFQNASTWCISQGKIHGSEHLSDENCDVSKLTSTKNLFKEANKLDTKDGTVFCTILRKVFLRGTSSNSCCTQ